MKKYISLLISLLMAFGMTALSVMAEESVLIDTEFTDLVYSSNNMELVEYTSPITNPQGTFNHQFAVIHPYAGVPSSGDVTYKVPDGAVISKFEILLMRPLNDAGGWDTFTIKGGNDGNAVTTIGAVNSMTPFNVSYNYVGGHGWYFSTTDATNALLKERSYDTLKIEFTTVAKVKKPPIGLQMIKIYYVMPSFESISADGVIIDDNSVIPAGMEQLEVNFNADVSTLEIADDDIILTMDDEKVETEFETSGAKVIIKPSQTLKYGSTYKLLFSEELRGGNIESIPEEFNFITSSSDFVSSDEVINNDGAVCSASLKIKNFRKTDTKAIACLVSYKNGQILDKNYTLIDSLIAGDDTEITTGEINSEEADEVLLMVWDNLFDMNPLIKEIKQ